jgi:acyl-CoA synthetase (AMP-forming)/AMP-acid ligase II
VFNNPATSTYHLLASAGELFLGVEAREADVDEVGKLYVRSEYVASGYWNNENATREAFIDQFYDVMNSFVQHRSQAQGYVGNTYGAQYLPSRSRNPRDLLSLLVLLCLVANLTERSNESM